MTAPLPDIGTNLARRFRLTRGRTERLCEPLAVEDYQLQSMPDCSPPKWHLAHTTWFFETFVLAPHGPGFRPHHPEFNFLFNSYYEAVGQRWPRPARGLLSRPTVAEVFAYRRSIDDQVLNLLETEDDQIFEAIAPLVELGMNHEEQHQELLLTDLKHAFEVEPTSPGLRRRPGDRPASDRARLDGVPGWVADRRPRRSRFRFRQRGPAHQVYLNAYRLASRAVTVGEYLAFIDDRGYSRPEFWLSDGWAARFQCGWNAPCTGRSPRTAGRCSHSRASVDSTRPNRSVTSASTRPMPTRVGPGARADRVRMGSRGCRHDVRGHFLDAGRFHPMPDPGTGQLFGDVWEWTASPYVGYRAIGRRRGRSASTTASSCATRWCSRAGRVSRRRAHPPDLSELLPARRPLAVLRLPARGTHEDGLRRPVPG